MIFLISFVYLFYTFISEYNDTLNCMNFNKNFWPVAYIYVYITLITLATDIYTLYIPLFFLLFKCRNIWQYLKYRGCFFLQLQKNGSKIQLTHLTQGWKPRSTPCTCYSAENKGEAADLSLSATISC